MVCKKCKKECLESELKNGICKECETAPNNKILLTIIISVIISVVVMLVITAWANNDASLSDFKIESFNLDTEKTTYTYSEDSLSYTGRGIISCKNKDNDYIILVEKKNRVNNEVEYIDIIVHNGVGELLTYDSSYSGATQKPEYEFNIIGYRSFKKNK